MVNGKVKKKKFIFFVDVYFVDNYYNMRIYYFYKSFVVVY